MFDWFKWGDGEGTKRRPVMVAPDPFALPKPDINEQAEHHLPLGTDYTIILYTTSISSTVKFGKIS